MKQYFHSQVDLLISVLPYIESKEHFALKGGTAINLFFRDMPRLSVDIDLVYLPIQDRENSIHNISRSLNDIAQEISQSGEIKVGILGGAGNFKKIICSRAMSEIKVEVNLVIRGSIMPPVARELCPHAQNLFKKFATINCLSFEETYAGKICAALDRQHPRDLFDIMMLIDNEGITEGIKDAFLIYLLSHNRPISELLSPNPRDISEDFAKSFDGMTDEMVPIKDLEEARSSLVAKIGKSLKDRDKEFLLSVKRNQARWDLTPFKGVENLPAIRWKISNISKMDKNKHKEALNKLTRVLEKI